MKKILFGSALVLSILVSFVPPTASAVEYGGLGGRPANPQPDNQRSASIFIYSLEQDKTVTDAVRLFNNTGETKTIVLGSVDSAPSNDGAFACSQEADPKNDVGSWITFDTNNITLNDGEEKVVSFSVKTPSNASVGEHSGCITIRDAQQKPSTNQSGVVLSFRSAIRVAVTIPGDIVKAISFTGISLSQHSTNQNLYTIQPSVVNTGNVSLDTALNVRLKNVLGSTVASKQATYPVLSASSAKWNFDVDKPFWGGWYSAEAVATYNSNPADGIGEETNGQRQSVTIQSNTLFIPPSPLAMIIELLAVVALAVSIVLLILKLRERAAIARSWQVYSANKNDTIQSIAEEHAISWQKLSRVNKLKAPYTITTGQEIKVPPKNQK
ncbi:MAG: LysM peptidoglycan-binding domain-containing protein [Candidatus Microsaccharimonas sp.]